MRNTIASMFLFSVVSCSCVAVGCGSKKPTNLCDGFQSYQTAQSVRDKLTRLGEIGNWHEELQGVAPPDRRPSYQLLSMSGPFSLSGIGGQLRLGFYNDRLMSAEFTTRKGAEYLAKLQEEHVTVPEESGKDIKIDRRTKFQYLVLSGGLFRFVWTDPQLENEWNEWVRRYA